MGWNRKKKFSLKISKRKIYIKIARNEAPNFFMDFNSISHSKSKMKQKNLNIFPHDLDKMIHELTIRSNKLFDSLCLTKHFKVIKISRYSRLLFVGIWFIYLDSFNFLQIVFQILFSQFSFELENMIFKCCTGLLTDN